MLATTAKIARLSRFWNHMDSAPWPGVPSRESATFPQRRLPHSSFRQAKNHRRPRSAYKVRASDEDEFEIFRFTLGIPFLDDEDVPCIVGLCCAACSVLNHLATVNASVAQARMEIMSILLVCACISITPLSRRLFDGSVVKAGRETGIVGGDEVFVVSPDVFDEVKAEMAWTTYAFLTQTNAKSVVVIENIKAKVLCARGSLCTRTENLEATLQDKDEFSRLTKLVKSSKLAHAARRGILYLKDRDALITVGADKWEFLPRGAQSVFIYIGIAKILVLLVSDQPSAFPKKQRARVMAVADKLLL